MTPDSSISDLEPLAKDAAESPGESRLFANFDLPLEEIRQRGESDLTEGDRPHLWPNLGAGPLSPHPEQPITPTQDTAS